MHESQVISLFIALRIESNNQGWALPMRFVNTPILVAGEEESRPSMWSIPNWGIAHPRLLTNVYCTSIAFAFPPWPNRNQ
jgi:hypothetical protein